VKCERGGGGRKTKKPPAEGGGGGRTRVCARSPYRRRRRLRAAFIGDEVTTDRLAGATAPIPCAHHE
jgi:hypothetical protein